MAEGTKNGPSFKSSLLAGGIAGFGVDVTMFPLDTIKTRLQSSQGFFKAGGFKGIYNGLGSAALGSAPSSALFFATYETSKKILLPIVPEGFEPLAHCTAASFGEIAACLFRVPTENVKQKMQAGLFKTTGDTVRGILKAGGPSGFFAGYRTTVLRDVPFSFLQFPVYEKLKSVWSAQQGSPLQGWQGAVCGSAAGAMAAGVTTPLDVAKTRMMLGNDAKGVPYTEMLDTLRRIHADGGTRGLYAGFLPRVWGMGIGGLIYFSFYEYGLRFLEEEEE